jgi:hypothetical protein
MVKKQFIIALMPIVFLLSCKKDKSIGSPAPSPSLICNPSFEINGQGSLHCWNLVKDFATYPDTFSTDVPPNGGQFSLRLEGVKDVNWDPYAETYVTNLSGQKIVSLSAYAKTLYGGQSIYLWLEHVRSGQVIKSKSDNKWAFSGWQTLLVTDTLTLQSQDSLRIKIVQTTGQNSSAYIDLVELNTN